MKVSTAHLESVRGLLSTASEKLADATKASLDAEASRLQLDGKVRGLQAAFDIAASAYASDSDLSVAQIEQLPIEAQTSLGYTKPAAPAPAV